MICVKFCKAIIFELSTLSLVDSFAYFKIGFSKLTNQASNEIPKVRIISGTGHSNQYLKTTVPHADPLVVMPLYH